VPGTAGRCSGNALVASSSARANCYSDPGGTASATLPAHASLPTCACLPERRADASHTATTFACRSIGKRGVHATGSRIARILGARLQVVAVELYARLATSAYALVVGRAGIAVGTSRALGFIRVRASASHVTVVLSAGIAVVAGHAKASGANATSALVALRARATVVTARTVG